MSGQIFVSYQRSDGPFVEKFVDRLAAGGVEAWYDHEIYAGDRWHIVIRERIESCAAFVVLMTPAAEASAWVNREIGHAEKCGKSIYPLLLEGEPFFRLNDLQYEDLRGGALPGQSFLVRLGVGPRGPKETYEFAGVAFGSAEQLADGIRMNWPAARELVMSHHAMERLMVWLVRRNPAIDAQRGSPNEDPDLAVAQLIQQLDPSGPSTFRGFLLAGVGTADDGELARMAGQAVADSWAAMTQTPSTPAVDAVESLWTSGALRYMTGDAQTALASYDAQWRDLVGVAEPILRTLPTRVRQPTDEGLLRAMLLTAVTDDAFRDRLATDAVLLVSQHGRVAWLAKLEEAARLPGSIVNRSEAAAYHTLMVLTGPRIPDDGLKRHPVRTRILF